MSFKPVEARFSPLPDLDRLRARALMVGVVGLVACGIGFVLDRDNFFRSWLIAYLLFLGIALGSMGLLMIQYLSGGAWGVFRRVFEASSRTLMEALWAAGCRVRAYDPVAMEHARSIYGNRGDFTLCSSAEDTLEGADALAIVTEWREFRSPSFDLIKSKLKTPVIFDGRNLYDPRLMRGMGFQYYAIGRGDSVSSSSLREERRSPQDRRRAQRS